MVLLPRFYSPVVPETSQFSHAPVPEGSEDPLLRGAGFRQVRRVQGCQGIVQHERGGLPAVPELALIGPARPMLNTT